ncbi:type II secretory pathway, component PulF [Thiohalobacter thiocyanaticus]|uniref:Type II secretory pathway, component PulF n=1 Tax=Thiohalobacter thiocyanaticus TaxID=585455 RepID=A0A1Z4VTR7_9GAMM|nr:type II secretion system F family protein [Thiohalobacter thiocyanaticus]BAZ95019.1 type II secretory pathway, component PulF [Thiohalobacter thiocyanaticus]
MAEKALKQDMFVWEGTDRRGNKVKGQTRANNQNLIKADLRRQGITPLKVKKKSALASGRRKKKIEPKDIAIFTRQLATMMSAGVPLVQAFDIIGRGHENPSMQELVMTIKTDVEGGSNLRDALAKHPLYFDELVCNLVEAGEAAGVLDTLLDKIATYKEKTEALKSKIKKALFYPTAVVVVAFIVTAILLIFVVPQFEELFAGFGADLPAFTRMVIDLSEFMQSYWWAVFGIIGGLIYGFMQAKRRSPAFNHTLDKIVLKLPIVGDILTKAAIARYARTLSTMFAAGVPLVEALDSVAGATGNSVYSNAVLRMRDQVSTGLQLQLAMNQTGLFPNMVVQMVAIGEEAGSLDAMLSKVADFYEQEVDDAVDGLSSLLEPLIMAILGVLVGGLVIAMYLPIFKMGQVV